MDSFWLVDNSTLERFVADELLYGLARAVEAQVFAGKGTGEQMTGPMNVSGAQVRPTSRARSSRLATR